MGICGGVKIRESNLKRLDCIDKVSRFEEYLCPEFCHDRREHTFLERIIGTLYYKYKNEYVDYAIKILWSGLDNLKYLITRNVEEVLFS